MTSRFVEVALVANVFSSGFVVWDWPFEVYVTYPVILGFVAWYIVVKRQLRVPRGLLMVMGTAGLLSLVNILAGFGELWLLGRQLIGIGLSAVAYYVFVSERKASLDRIIATYVNIATVVAGIGVVQFSSFLLGVEAGYDYAWLIPKWRYVVSATGFIKVNSIMPEPAHLAIALAPAGFLSLARLLGLAHVVMSTWKAILILGVEILSFSALAYLGIAASLVLLWVDNRTRFRYAVALAMVAAAVVLWLPDISVRVADLYAVLDAGESGGSLGTVGTLYLNAVVAADVLLRNPLFGFGLGSHLKSYDRFWGDVVDVGGLLIGTNREDANSLLLRLLSELGLLGVGIVLYFISVYARRGRYSDWQCSVNRAVLVLFLLRLLREGHYFVNGLFLFVWIYYFTSNLKSAVETSAESARLRPTGS